MIKSGSRDATYSIVDEIEAGSFTSDGNININSMSNTNSNAIRFDLKKCDPRFQEENKTCDD
jgi:hypothetical protein